MDMYIDKLSKDQRFLFITMMQTAIKIKELGLNEEDLLELAKGCWETLKLNDLENLKNLLQESMYKDINDFSKNNDFNWN